MYRNKKDTHFGAIRNHYRMVKCMEQWFHIYSQFPCYMAVKEGRGSCSTPEFDHLDLSNFHREAFLRELMEVHVKRLTNVHERSSFD